MTVRLRKAMGKSQSCSSGWVRDKRAWQSGDELTEHESQNSQEQRQRKAKREDVESKWAEKTKEVKDVVLFIGDPKGDWRKSAKETARREKAPVQQPTEVGTHVKRTQGSLEELKLLSAGRKRQKPLNSPQHKTARRGNKPRVIPSRAATWFWTGL